MEELELLARAFLAAPDRLTREACEALRAHAWHGNGREFKNVLTASGIRAGSGRIRRGHLNLGASIPDASQRPIDLEGPRTRRAAEHALIRATLARCRGNRSQAARILGIDRSTPRRKLPEMGDQ